MYNRKEQLKSVCKQGAAASALAKYQRAKERFESLNLSCRLCGKKIPAKTFGEGVSWASVQRRKFCSHSCVQKYSWKQPDIRNGKKALHERDFTLEMIRKTRKNWVSAVRGNARLVYKLKNNLVCERCGYDKHINVCHIKALKDCSMKELLKNINSFDNLIGLCPNCHWEFDNGLLELPLPKKKPSADAESKLPISRQSKRFQKKLNYLL